MYRYRHTDTIPPPIRPTPHAHTSHSAQDRDPGLHALKLQQFSPALSQLVLVLVGLMRYPVGTEADGGVAWEEMDREEKEERVDYRYKLVRPSWCFSLYVRLHIYTCICEAGEARRSTPPHPSPPPTNFK